MKPKLIFHLGLVVLAAGLLHPPHGLAQEKLPVYLQDREAGIPASLFGTYIHRGRLLIFPFFEYARDNNREYQPAMLGFGLNQDFRGKYRDSRGVIFIAYGLTDWLAIEFEAASIKATFEKARSDASATPAKIKESGLGDFEWQFRARLTRERDRRPEVFGFLEITAPSQKRKVLIGDSEWDFKPGLGVIRGFSWGTLTLRTTVEYTRDDASLNLGETSLEYLKRLSPAWRVNFGIEGGEAGGPDEWELISGVQWRMTDFAFLKLDNALGIVSKATDWTPQLGIMFALPVL